MTASPLNIFLVDEDPVFRLGLQIWLDQQPAFHVVGTANTGDDALQQLTTLQTDATRAIADAGSTDPPVAVDVVVVDLGLGQTNPQQMPGFEVCRRLKQHLPQLKILVLSAQVEPVLQEAAQQLGVEGFGWRGATVQELAQLIQQTHRPTIPLTDPRQDITWPALPQTLLAALRQQSLGQIDAAIAEVTLARGAALPTWYRIVLAGQQRELKAARWLIQRLLTEGASMEGDRSTLSAPSPKQPSRRQSTGTTLRVVPSPSLIPVEAIHTRVCEAVFCKLQFSLANNSNLPLELDILRAEKCRELLYSTLQCFERLLEDLRQADIPPGQLSSRSDQFLLDLWNTVTIDFFGRYYTPPIDSLEQPLVAILQQDAPVVEQAILKRIPQVPELLHHLLFHAAFDIEGVTYLATTPEALRHSQFLLENLLIQVACGVMQPLLNRYAEVESFKRNLYHRKMMSTRDIVRFRNDLSWRYRWDLLVTEPKAIFESQYRLWVLTPQGIQTHCIYAPRSEELAALSGWQYWTTLALEARDAIAPRLRSAIAFLGGGVVFVLTEIVGRGIGLIGRGMVKGIGNAWQDNRIRYRRRDEA